jgi:hypothetical protein
LARAADCVACHSIPGGKGLAGGLKMGTPLGAIYSTNITPDPETGLGRYSLADFDLAVRYGIAKDGHYLYPAMPYPSYAKLTDADVVTLYRFFMEQVPPVHQANLKSEIPALLSFRWPLAFWNFFFAPSAGYVAKSDHDAVWNRGAYLVKALPIAAPATPRAASDCRRRRSMTAARTFSPERSSTLGMRQVFAAICGPASVPGRRRTSASFSSMATTGSVLRSDR